MPNRRFRHGPDGRESPNATKEVHFYDQSGQLRSLVPNLSHAYWVTTVIIVAELAVDGVWDILRVPYVRPVIEHLGYPAYFLVILGVWKVAGAVALLVPRFPRLKEWAYAGTFFELTGAIASHAVSGSRGGHLIWPGFFAVCTIISWALRPQSRTLGVLFSANPGGPGRPQC